MDPWLIVFGFGVGALVGATGMGGGSLMTPLLILLFGIKPVVAVGSDLAYAAITKTAGGYLHLRKGTVQTIRPLTDGSGAKFTTAEYLTPSGDSIEGSGVVPDREVEDREAQLDAAVEAVSAAALGAAPAVAGR